MRSLSESIAQRCEEAREPVCRCRCKGALHGAKRGKVTDLPIDDPHCPTRKCRACDGTGTKANLYSSWDCTKCGGVGRLVK